MNRNHSYPPIHKKIEYPSSFQRLDMLWDRYPQHHKKQQFTTLEQLLADHESYQTDFEETLQEEYREKQYEQFLVQLSWMDLPYRQETRRLIEAEGPLKANPYVEEFLAQFAGIDTDRKAIFLFPESFTTPFFVIEEICKRAEYFAPIRNLFPDEKTLHYLAVFDKQQMDDVLLMYHLLYTNASSEVYGGYSLYDYSLPWYHHHLRQDGTVLRSPYLPDRLAKFQGNLPYYHNPAKTVYVRRNIEHILKCGHRVSGNTTLPSGGILWGRGGFEKKTGAGSGEERIV